jgi:biotin carboxyl carrier protein
MKYFAKINDIEYQIEILSETEVLIDSTPHQVDFQALRQHLSYSVLMDGESFETNIYPEDGEWEVLLRGRQFSVLVEDERDKQLRLAAGQSTLEQDSYILKAPMPGLVIDIPVADGDQVKEGDVLLILESMKMQNELKAPRAGTITRIQTEMNANVERNQILLVLE